ncbi:MAG: hypothetical protein C0408_10670 [Odoribacter sp.]|nr:hypothetical protein [Odoribacter sp.]
MFFSFAKYDSKPDSKSLLKVLKRTALIFIIGLFLNSFPQWQTDFSKLRIMGVLQRIALAYGIGAVIILTVNKKYLPYIALSILLIYWGILYFLSGPDPYSLSGNLAPKVDSFLLGEAHLYKGFGPAFDPEGLLSTFPSIATVILGFMAGGLISKTEKAKIPLYLLLYGAIGVITGIVWGQFFPVNKPLWTSSYVIYTAGLACILMAILIWIIDLKGYTKWTSFFVVFGMNPLFIFALSGIWARILTRLIKIHEDEQVINGYNWLYQKIFMPVAGELNGSLLFALAHILVFWFICYVLYKKKIFIKV